ncbi:MAG: TRAP transporter small permease [Wenzhouxiangellaceae bacterium]|jgi:TRAP-type C4-dicarboxylate transport system permease small subunit|nr:TRAP transporter small permease [Wenzhouxiangellaceae bacterium]MBS3746930.1 TRAP transporter small permease [Wenzhouxiangellaceae bacterium]MBS3823778.1 TRAP transporter small permease [Wenzhouxiangellaceae bacterium]
MSEPEADVPGRIEPPPEGRLARLAHNLEIGLLTLIFGAIVVIGLSQIGLRNLADSSLVWADAAMRAGVLWITMLAGVLAAGQARHIKIDALLHRLPEKVRPWIQRAMYLLTALVCVTLAAASVNLIQLEMSMNDLAFLNVPRWAVLIIIPIGFALMGWRFMRHALVLYPPGKGKR